MTPEQVRDECERLLSLYGDGFVLRVPQTGERLTSAMVREELAKANEQILRRAGARVGLSDYDDPLVFVVPVANHSPPQ